VWGARSRRPDEVTYREMMRVLREAGRLREALHVCAGLRKIGAHPERFGFCDPYMPLNSSHVCLKLACAALRCRTSGLE